MTKKPTKQTEKAKSQAPKPVVAAPAPKATVDPATALIAATADRLLEEGSLGKLAEMLGLNPRTFAEAIVQLAMYPDADPPRLTPLGKAPLTPPQLSAVMQKAVAELRESEAFLGQRSRVLQVTQRKSGDPRVTDAKLEAELAKKLRFGSRGL